MNTIVQAYNDAKFTIEADLISEVCNVIEKTENKLHKYMTKDFRSEIPMKLKELGWSDNIYLHPNSRINITSMKNHIGLCIQTGNVSRVYADLLKLQSLCSRGTIEGGIIILPTGDAVKSFGSNVATLERLEREMPIFNNVITMPMILIGFYEE